MKWLLALTVSVSAHAETYKPTRIIPFLSDPNKPMIVRVYRDWDQAARDVQDPNSNDFEWAHNATTLIEEWSFPFLHVPNDGTLIDLNGDGWIDQREAWAQDENFRAALKALLDAGHIEDPDQLLGPAVA